MAVINSIAGFAEEMAGWRRHLHAHPELSFDCHETAKFVEEKLRSFGITEIETGVATSGVVAIIEGQGDGPTIGLRADMDALPIHEETGVEYASTVPGKMHACGHDGHTAMLLGAAKYLSETRKFRGRVALLFQPAEEDGGGGQVMVQEGVMDRHGITQVYGIHNVPDLPLGQIEGRVGPALASFDEFTVEIQGKGGHAAQPHDCTDPLLAGAGMVTALQSVVSRNLAPSGELVISVTQFHAGHASNVIADTAMIQGTVRSFEPEVRQMARERIHAILEGQAASFGVTVSIDYFEGYPATRNHLDETAFAFEVARDVVGEQNVNTEAEKTLGAEDFAYMLEARPGAYLMVGGGGENGGTGGLHHPKYNFNDDMAPIGASYLARLVERAQPLS